MFDTTPSEGNGSSDFDGETQSQPQRPTKRGTTNGANATRYQKRTQVSNTLDQRRQEERQMNADLDQGQLSTLRQLMQMRLIESMVSREQRKKSNTNCEWTRENHDTLITEIITWLDNYNAYLRELVTSKRIKNPNFEEWAYSGQTFPNVSEDAFINWINHHGEAFEKIWEGGTRDFTTFLRTLYPSETLH